MLNWIKQKLQKSSDYIGVDIGASGIKLLELKSVADSYLVLNYVIAPLPVGAIVENEIKDSSVVATALRKAIADTGIKNKNAIIALPDATVVSKIIQIDAALDERAAEEHILCNTDQYISISLEEINLDFQLLGIHAKNPQLRDVLLVFSRQQPIDTRIAALAEVGLMVQVVEIESHAISRVIGQWSARQIIAVVNIGCTSLSMTVVRDKQILFTRSESCDGQLVLETVLLQLRRILQFFFSTHTNLQIQSILLAGGGALLPEIAAFLNQQLAIPTQLANPFKGMSFAETIDPAVLTTMAPRFLLACGLAMRSK
jgi:type IV pilus assembly protein PilM